MESRTALFTHPDSLGHKMSAWHPERPERIEAIMAELESQGLMDKLLQKQAGTAVRTDLARVHGGEYIDWLFENAPREVGQRLIIDGDTSMNEHSLAAALTGAGAVLDAVDGVMAGELDNAFCCVRPPGHHAETSTAMGFCFFDNVAVGAAHVLETCGLERVAIVDFDVHHGNGTEAIFLDEPRVLFCSTFQEHIFPGRYMPSQPGHIVNVPLPDGCDGQLYRDRFNALVMPELDTFKPQFVFISAGFDAHRKDPLAGLNLEAEDFGWITRQVLDIADRHAGGMLVSTLEGGYDLDALAQSASAHVKALLGMV